MHNVVTQVFTDQPNAHVLLREVLAYRDKGYFFSPAYKNGSWDGYTRMYLAPTVARQFGKFWTGLLNRAMTVLTDAGYDCQVHDKRTKPAPGARELAYNGVARADYQTPAVQAILERSRGIIQVPTAGGKTPIASQLIAELNIPTLFIAHRIGLVTQAKAEFERSITGVRVGIIQASNVDIQRVNVATIQSLDSMLDSEAHQEVRNFVENDCQLVIVDEAHHSSAPSYKRVLQRFVSAYYRVGLTATPFKNEGAPQGRDLEVVAMFGRVVYQVQRRYLQERAYLAKARVFFVESGV